MLYPAELGARRNVSNLELGPAQGTESCFVYFRADLKSRTCSTRMDEFDADLTAALPDETAGGELAHVHGQRERDLAAELAAVFHGKACAGRRDVYNGAGPFCEATIKCTPRGGP